jgi:hypothetical protein
MALAAPSNRFLIGLEYLIGTSENVSQPPAMTTSAWPDLCRTTASRNRLRALTRRVDALIIMKRTSRRCGTATTPSTQLQVKKLKEITPSH